MNSLAVGTFWISSLLILPLWSLMWFMPKHAITKKYVGDIRWSILPLLIPYTLLAVPNAPDILLTFMTQMPTPELVVELSEDETVIALAWLHMLAFDLFVGRYVWLRMLAADRPMYVSTPILVLCTMMSPLGFLLGLLATWQQRDLGNIAFEDHSETPTDA